MFRFEKAPAAAWDVRAVGRALVVARLYVSKEREPSGTPKLKERVHYIDLSPLVSIGFGFHLARRFAPQRIFPTF